MRSEIIVPVILSESIIQGKDGGRSENEEGGGARSNRFKII